MPEPVASAKMSLNEADMVKVGKGAVLAVTAAALTYLAQNATDIKFGQYTPFVVSGLAILLNMVRKWAAAPPDAPPVAPPVPAPVPNDPTAPDPRRP